MSSASAGPAELQLRRARGDLETGLRAGEDRRAETLLAAFPALAADPEAAIELVYTEFVVREELGQGPTPAEWYARFPQWRADLEQMFQVHDALCRSTVSPGGRAEPAPAPGRGVAVPGYEILEELGRGGMGVVYRARHAALNREVAVKVIRGGGDAGANDRERFRREAGAAARLDHPNIVRVFEVGEHAGRPYCVMEYVAGGSLATRMSGKPWPERAAARLVADLARAADHAHRRGVVHRDLKPGNILLHGAGGEGPGAGEGADCLTARPSPPAPPFTPKIVDFGLAKCLNGTDPTLTRSGDVVGTPLYMAPEQAGGGAIGPAVDVWALGIILYELLTGHPPFQGDSATETLRQVLSAEPVPPRRLRTRLPRDLDTICLRCLEKDPGRRYGPAAAVAADLDRWARGEPIAARPVRWPEVAGKWARREPVVAGLAAGIAAVAALGLGGIVWQWQRADRERDDAVTAGERATAARVEAERVGGLEAAARGDAEAELYASQIARAAYEVAAARPAAAERLLDDCKDRGPDRCRWEWDYLKRKCQTHLLTLPGHTLPVNSVEYSPDGRLLASGSGGWNGNDPGEVKVWDAATGALLHDLRGPKATVYRVAFHPGGTELAAACRDGRVWRWDLRRPDSPLPPLVYGRDLYAVAYHPDGRSVAACSADGGVQVWDPATGRSRGRWRWHEHNVNDVSYSPDGLYIATACRDGIVAVRAATDYRLVRELRVDRDARRVVFGPDGRYVATQSPYGEVAVWDAANGFERVATHSNGSGSARGVAFRPDGRHLASPTRDTDVRVWAVRGLAAAPYPFTGIGYAHALAYSPDARRIAVAREDRVIRVWDLTAPPEPRTVAWGNAWVNAIALAPDGRSLALAGGNHMGFGTGPKTIRVMPFSGGPGVDLDGHEGWPTAVAFRPDGRQLASADGAGAVILWDPAARRPQTRLAGHTGAVTGVAYHPDGTSLATAGADHAVRLWDPAAGAERGRLDHPAPVLAVAYSSDGRFLATGCADRVVRVWDAATRTLRHALAGHGAGVNALAFRPGSAELVSAAEDQDLRFWDADTGRNRTVHAPPAAADTPAAGPDGRYGTHLAFSPDGHRLAFGSTTRPVQVWDADARRPLLDLGEPGVVQRHCVVFSADGKQLVAANQYQIQFFDSAVERPADRLAAADRRGAGWHADRAAADLDESHWYGAEFHTTRLLADSPADADLYARRGEARAAQGKAAGAAADHAAAVALSSFRFGLPPAFPPGTGDVWNRRGEACAHRGDWPGAIRAAKLAILHEPQDALHWYNLASAHLAAGDRDGYRETCREMARRFATAPAETAELVLKALAPLDAGLGADTWIGLGWQALPGGGDRMLGAAYYRAGCDMAALASFAPRKIGDYPRASQMLFRAMIYRRFGQPAAADVWMTRARVWIAEADRIATDPTVPGGTRWESWNERVAVRSLLREAETLPAGPAEK